MTVAACVKWVVPRDGDARYGGISPADHAAIEWALRIGEARAEPVHVLTLGPPAVDGVLRDALACGVAHAVRVDASTALDSADVAAALARVVDGATVVCCGDASPDRGTGSVPAFLAARLGAAQALGLVDLAIEPDRLVGLRRLDGGRRERVALPAGTPCVLSVEGATASSRRASLAATLGARHREITVVPGPSAAATPERITRPYRPRARVLPAPVGASALDRLRVLLGSGAEIAGHADPITLEPTAAADRILAALTEWGYRDV